MEVSKKKEPQMCQGQHKYCDPPYWQPCTRKGVTFEYGKWWCKRCAPSYSRRQGPQGEMFTLKLPYDLLGAIKVAAIQRRVPMCDLVTYVLSVLFLQNNDGTKMRSRIWHKAEALSKMKDKSLQDLLKAFEKERHQTQKDRMWHQLLGLAEAEGMGLNNLCDLINERAAKRKGGKK